MIYAIAGRRENGKTTLAEHIARQLGLRSYWDPRREFHSVPAVEFLLPQQDQQNPIVIVQPDVDPREEFVDFCETLRGWIRAEQDAGLVVQRSIVIDEVRDADLTCHPFSWLSRCVRRDQVNIILTAHRPTNIPPDVRAIVDVWCFFQTTLDHDLDVVEEKGGPGLAELVKKLEPREFVWWDDARAIATPCKNPRAWFVPLRPATPAIESTGSVNP